MAIAQRAVNDPNAIRFAAIECDDPVSYIELSDEGLLLAIVHGGSDAVSLYDVASKTITARLDVKSPRVAIIRRGKIIVGSREMGKITIFEKRRDQWQLDNEITVPQFGMVHLSAAYDRTGDQSFLLTCHGDGVSASYQDSKILALDRRGKAKTLGKSALAALSYDGSQIITQRSFNLSPSGAIAGYRSREFLLSGGDCDSIFTAGVSSTPYVYQVAKGPYWIGRNQVFLSNPGSVISREVGNVIAPDRTQAIIYGLAEEKLTAHRLDATLTPIDSRPVEYPPQYWKKKRGRSKTELFNKFTHQRSYVLDHPEATTLGD
ncbi:MAG: hypothetical protein AAFP69_03625, partial [Planctomycetota bacterium]